MPPLPHQYIERNTRRVRTENLIGDQAIKTIYSTVRESAPFAFNLALSSRMSAVLGFLNYDFPIFRSSRTPDHLFKKLEIRTKELYDPPQALNTVRKVFERRIRYWDARPMNPCQDHIASPADSRILLGSFQHQHALFIKEKLFKFEELFGTDKAPWLRQFSQGDFAVCRLTPDKYHFNHTPVSGKVVDLYEVDGQYHSCNPGAVVRSVTPYSKNRRVITIIDTDVKSGTGIGMVAMIEVVAMMIGRIVQCYSPSRYDDAQDVRPGLFLKKGQPKSLFRPGSSTTVLVFEKDRIQFNEDLLANQTRTDVQSRFSQGFGKPLVETDIRVRETIGEKK